jgi:hypothetical protein
MLQVVPVVKKLPEGVHQDDLTALGVEAWVVLDERPQNALNVWRVDPNACRMYCACSKVNVDDELVWIIS